MRVEEMVRLHIVYTAAAWGMSIRFKGMPVSVP